MFLPGLRSSPYGLLPLAASGCLLVGVVVPYIIAVRLNHVYPFLPFISDTGALHPENCVFGQMLNMTSFFLVLTVYFRYKQVAQEGPTDLQEFNKVATLLGYAAALFLSLVGNVQVNIYDENSIETRVHQVSSDMTFGTGLVFSLAQTWLTYKLADGFCAYCLVALRLTLTLAGGVFAATLVEFRSLANAEFNGTYAQTLHWNPHDGGYVYHVYSSASEYMVTFILMLVIGSMYKDLNPTAESKTSAVEKVAATDLKVSHGPMVYVI